MPTPTPFDTIAWHDAFDATVSAGIADSLDLMRLVVFVIVLVGGVVAAAVIASLVAQVRVR